MLLSLSSVRSSPLHEMTLESTQKSSLSSVQSPPLHLRFPCPSVTCLHILSHPYHLIPPSCRYLNNNQFSGTIPDIFSSLTMLTELHFEDNRLVGFLPPSMGLLTRLNSLNLQRNSLTGAIPASLSRLSELWFL
ncbi:unnamed protein product [Closterium sp. Yama58-4]|nr:unnamed protein product [Closterium sp. Yama58-4]